MGRPPEENGPTKEIRNAVLGLMGATTAASDQAETMTDAELAERLLTGRWSTIEVHEAGRRLARRVKSPPEGTKP